MSSLLGHCVSWSVLQETLPGRSNDIGAAASIPQLGLVVGIGTHGFCHMCNIQTQSWTRLSQMNKERHACSVLYDQDKMYAMGGISHGFLASVECHRVYEQGQQRGVRVMMPEMSQERCYCATAIVKKGQIAVVGGATDNGARCFESAEIFDTERKTWQRLPDI